MQTTSKTDSLIAAPRYAEEHVVTLVKSAGRKLSEGTIKTNLDTIIAGTFTGARAARGWSARIQYRAIDSTDEYDTSRIDPLSETETFYSVKYVPETAYAGKLEYRANIIVSLDTERQRDSIRVELENILTTIHARGAYPKWAVEQLDGGPFTIKSAALATQSITVGGGRPVDAADAIGYAPCVVPNNWETHFGHLFGLSDHIGMVRDPIQTAIQTNWQRRFHTKLIGPPGCGKSAVLRAMKNAVGEEAVMEFDATATTAAGALEMLGEYEELPRIMIVEELEKAPTDTFQFLLGLMDDRAEVRKITARKKIARETRLLVFATINDESILDKAMDGALSSRFSNPVYFSRPSRDLMEKILEREVKNYGGDEVWIEPALELAYDTLNISDPRRIIAMMMLGKYDLISGEYQRRMLTVGMAHKVDVEDTDDSVKGRLARLVERIQS